MGFLTGILTLPLAPVRATVWLAEQIAEQAARELDTEAGVRRQLAELELQHELGELPDEEYERLEDDLLERLSTVGEESPAPPAGAGRWE